MDNRGAHLRLYVVANERKIFIREAFGPCGIARDEDWDIIDKTESGLQRTTSVKSGRLLRSNGKIIDH